MYNDDIIDICIIMYNINHYMHIIHLQYHVEGQKALLIFAPPLPCHIWWEQLRSLLFERKRQKSRCFHTCKTKCSYLFCHFVGMPSKCSGKFGKFGKSGKSGAGATCRVEKGKETASTI